MIKPTGINMNENTQQKKAWKKPEFYIMSSENNINGGRSINTYHEIRNGGRGSGFNPNGTINTALPQGQYDEAAFS